MGAIRTSFRFPQGRRGKPLYSKKPVVDGFRNMSNASEHSENGRALIRLAAGVLFLGVLLGAFGAHGFHDLLASRDRIPTWNTAVLYHLVHGLALLVLGATVPSAKGVWWSLLTGIILFSGSLYLLCLTGMNWLGAVTPLGGLSFLIGWGWLALRR